MDLLLHRKLIEKTIPKQPKLRNKYKVMLKLKDNGIFWKEDFICWRLKIPMRVK